MFYEMILTEYYYSRKPTYKQAQEHEMLWGNGVFCLLSTAWKAPPSCNLAPRKKTWWQSIPFPVLSFISEYIIFVLNILKLAA